MDMKGTGRRLPVKAGIIHSFNYLFFRSWVLVAKTSERKQGDKCGRRQKLIYFHLNDFKRGAETLGGPLWGLTSMVELSSGSFLKGDLDELLQDPWVRKGAVFDKP